MSQASKLTKQVSKKIKIFDTKLKTSFILIRQDLDDMQIVIDAMRKYLKKKDKEYKIQNKHTVDTQVQIQKTMEDFTKEFIKLKLFTAQINAIKSEVVIRKDLAKIEDRIKTSFAKEIQKYKNETKSMEEKLKESNKRIKALEKRKIYKKKSWLSK
jgi:predicted  nucleic acid-binding Zn-ribbon protein